MRQSMRVLTGCMTAAALVPLLLSTACSSRSLPLRVSPRSSDDLVDRTVRFFTAFLRRNPTGNLAPLRPAPLNPAGIRAVVATLPLEGNLEPTADERLKLEALRPILSYHEREQVLVIQVIDLPQAAVGLHGRAVLLLSRPALRLLSAGEIQAVAAHELGHEFFWNEYAHARAQHEVLTLQELELKCDGIAVFTLLGLRFETDRLASALRKLMLFNERFGANPNTNNYPALEDRARFISALQALERRDVRGSGQ